MVLLLRAGVCLVLSCCSSRFVCECYWLFGSQLSIGLYLAITIVVLHSDCSCCGVQVSLGGTDVMVIIILIENVLTSLLMINDCWGKQTKTTSKTVAVIEAIEANTRYIYI